MEQDISTESYSTTVTDVNPEFYVHYLSRTEMNDTEITSEYFNVTEVANEHFNATTNDDYIIESIGCEYEPLGVITTTIEEFYETFMAFLPEFDVVPAELAIALLIIGILGNVVNIFVFTRPVMRNPMNKLLATMEFVNLFVFFGFIPQLIRHYHPKYQNTFALVILKLVELVLTTAAVCFSNWLTVQVGIWRYVAINWPLKVRRLCGWTRTKIAILVIAIVSILISIPYSFIYTYERFEFNLTYNYISNGEFSELVDVYAIRVSELACLNPIILKFSELLYILTTLAPCTCMGILTCFLLRSLWVANAERRILTGTKPRRPPSEPTSRNTTPYNRNETEREKRLTILLTVLVFLYFLANVPGTLINILQLAGENPEPLVGYTFYGLVKTRIGLLLCNSATFLIYFAMSEKYRETLRTSLLPLVFAKDLSKK